MYFILVEQRCSRESVSRKWYYNEWQQSYFDGFFFPLEFSFTDTDKSQDSRETKLTNIQTFICNFAREMAITYF